MPPFITLDGIDGVGKSTQIENLTRHLTDLGHDVINVRDPGSTEIGSRLRAILLDSDLEIHRRTEAMLFMASRCEMIESTLRPAIEAGKTVISDRFLLANVVYQSVVYQSVGVNAGGGGSVTAEQLWEMGGWANAGFRPDLTILLDMPATASVKRLEGEADRMEARGVEYLESVRQAFLTQLPHSSEQTAIINADQPLDEVTSDVIAAVDEFLR